MRKSIRVRTPEQTLFLWGELWGNGPNTGSFTIFLPICSRCLKAKVFFVFPFFLSFFACFPLPLLLFSENSLIGNNGSIWQIFPDAFANRLCTSFQRPSLSETKDVTKCLLFALEWGLFPRAAAPFSGGMLSLGRSGSSSMVTSVRAALKAKFNSAHSPAD